MKNKFGKYKKYLLILFPFVAIGIAGLTYYFVIKNQSTKSEYIKSEDVKEQFTTSDSQTIYGVEVFPKLTIYDFYQELRIDDGKCIITDDFVASVITRVLSQSKITDGNIYFDYVLSNDRQNLSVSFEWKKDEANNFWQTYNFSLSV